MVRLGSVGTKNAFKHGMVGTGVYKSWQAMKQRCHQPSHPYYPNYGGRGIKVCDKWLTFEEFYSDMGDRPHGHSLDRIDRDGDYELSNCRWAEKEQQSNNKVDNHFLEWNGRSLTIAQWSRELGITKAVIEGRLRMGWEVDKIFTTPPADKSRKYLEYQGQCKKIAEWAKELGISSYIIRNRIYAGWTTADILTTPVKNSKGKSITKI